MSVEQLAIPENSFSRNGNGHHPHLLDSALSPFDTQPHENGLRNGHTVNGTALLEKPEQPVTERIKTMVDTVRSVLDHPDWMVPEASKYPGANLARITESDGRIWNITYGEQTHIRTTHTRKRRNEIIKTVDEVRLAPQGTPSEGQTDAFVASGKVLTFIDGEQSPQTTSLPGNIEYAEAVIQRLGNLRGVSEGGTVTRVENLGSSRGGTVFPERESTKMGRLQYALNTHNLALANRLVDKLRGSKLTNIELTQLGIAAITLREKEFENDGTVKALAAWEAIPRPLDEWKQGPGELGEEAVELWHLQQTKASLEVKVLELTNADLEHERAKLEKEQPKLARAMLRGESHYPEAIKNRQRLALINQLLGTDGQDGGSLTEETLPSEVLVFQGSRPLSSN